MFELPNVLGLDLGSIPSRLHSRGYIVMVLSPDAVPADYSILTRAVTVILVLPAHPPRNGNKTRWAVPVRRGHW